MAVPARRVSKTRKNKRRSHHQINVPSMVKCPNCSELKISHRICSNCGHYKDKEIVSK